MVNFFISTILNKCKYFDIMLQKNRGIEMNKISIKDVNNQIIDATLVRYFKYKNKNYLIYTFNYIYEKGFVKF